MISCNVFSFLKFTLPERLAIFDDRIHSVSDANDRENSPTQKEKIPTLEMLGPEGNRLSYQQILLLNLFYYVCIIILTAIISSN